MHDDLTTLAVRHGTDKFGYHDYTPNYHAMFARFRDRPLRVLEIGVGGYADEDRGGESLATWRDYFPQGRIIGIDIQKKVLDLGPRVRIFQGSQVDAEFLAEVVREEGPFDLIIDDGSHRNEHVVETFKLLFPGLVPGGIYAVEDTQTAFFPRFGGSLDLAHPNTIGFFAQFLVKLLTGTVGPDIADTPAEGLCAIERFHNIVALHKAGAEGDAPPISWLSEPPESGREALAAPWETTLSKTNSPALLEAEFQATPDGGALLIDASGTGPELAEFLRDRFVEIDHMERRVHFPEAPLHAMARDLRALSITREAIAFWRAPNLYPSNFTYDIEAPQAAAAIARMGEIMSDGKAWQGAISLAGLLSRHGQSDRALELIRRFGNGDGQPRAFFEMAVRVMLTTGHRDEVRGITEAGAANFPNDPKLVSDVAMYVLQDGDAERAAGMLHGLLEQSPRNRLLHSRLGRVQFAQGKLEEAVKSTEMAIKLTPATVREALQLFLAQIRLRQQNYTAALAVLTPLADREGAGQERAYRLISEAHTLAGDREAALDAIDRAIALKPENPAYLRWRERLVSMPA
jgi:tetratricopeptide (TPR) repeat protein